MLAMDHVEAPLLATLNLPASPHIVVAGAYKGDTTRFLLEHYPDAHIEAYEPQPWALKEVPDDPRVDKIPYALTAGIGDRFAHSFGTDACSICPKVYDLDRVPMQVLLACVDAVNALEKYQSEPLSLMVLNVEGYEYTLLPYMLENSIVPVRLLVQFHHYKTHEAAAFNGVLAMLQHEYLEVREVGKGWWYCA